MIFFPPFFGGGGGGVPYFGLALYPDPLTKLSSVPIWIKTGNTNSIKQYKTRQDILSARTLDRFCIEERNPWILIPSKSGSADPII
jgi:hypothetical protein